MGSGLTTRTWWWPRAGRECDLEHIWHHESLFVLARKPPFTELSLRVVPTCHCSRSWAQAVVYLVSCFSSLGEGERAGGVDTLLKVTCPCPGGLELSALTTDLSMAWLPQDIPNQCRKFRTNA